MGKIFIFASILTIVFTGCIGDVEEKEWTSLIYPDKNNTKRSKKHGIYNSLEECKKASKEELTKLDLLKRGSFQCGLNCEYHEGMKLDICEKMSK